MFSHRNGRTEKVPAPPLDYTILRFSMAFMVFPRTNMLAYIWYTMVHHGFSFFVLFLCSSTSMLLTIYNLYLYVWYYSPANSDSELENHHVAQLNLSMVQNMSKAIWRFPEMGVPPQSSSMFFKDFPWKNRPAPDVPWDLVGTSDFGHGSMVALNSPSPD